MNTRDRFLTELSKNGAFTKKFLSDPTKVLKQLGLKVVEMPETSETEEIQSVLAGCASAKKSSTDTHYL